LFDQAFDAIYTRTRMGHLTSWNKGAEALYGFTAAEAIGRKSHELLNTVFSAGRAACDAALDDHGLWDGQLRQTCKDGRVVVVESRMSRVTNDDPFEVLVVNRDITARLEAEEALRQSEMRLVAVLRDVSESEKSASRFRSVLEAAPDAMVIVNQTGAIVLVNAQTERLFGYHRDELIGQGVELLVPRRFRGSHTTHRHAYFAEPSPRGMGTGLELFGLRKDGSEFPIEISLSPIHTEEGTLVSSAIRDITARRQLESRMREASRLKSEFLANMSHELRTPLNAIIGFADLMYRGKVGSVSAEHHEYLGDILVSSRHLLQLINDVLDLAKVESGKMQFHPETVDLNALVSEVRDTLRGLAASRELTVEAVVDAEAATVVTDAGRVKQILYNYMSNAIKFTPPGGRVTVRITPDSAAMFRLDVADTGVGISAADIGKLFIEFQQIDASAAKAYQGTGLGLALTKRLTEALGGRVAVRSTPNVGSLFSAILPRTMTMTAVDRRIALPAAPASNAAGRSVLVVDDDPVAVRMVEATLRERGYRPRGFTSAVDALHAAAADPPAVAIVDLLMPGLDGFRFIERFQAAPFGSGVPIIVWSVKDLDAADRGRLDSTAVSIVSKRSGGAAALVAELERLLPSEVPLPGPR
jgi:PAS domain S-box-containing protein